MAKTQGNAEYEVVQIHKESLFTISNLKKQY